MTQLEFIFEQESPSPTTHDPSSSPSNLTDERRAEILADIRRRRQMRDVYASLSDSMRA